MQNAYYSDATENRAALFLATCSPDMVDDIVRLVQQRGRTVVATIFSRKDGPGRPNAIFSREFISDSDFQEFLYGMTATWLAEMRDLKSDNDYYESVLIKAFGIPKVMAAEMAARIETRDIVGKFDAGGNKLAWYTRLYNSTAEGIRKGVNWVAEVFHTGWENDQNQSFDVDYLYEVKLLGSAVMELNSRKRLMDAQIAISAGMKLWNGTKEAAGDPEGLGDVERDLFYGDAFRSLATRPMHSGVMGGFNNLARYGEGTSRAMKVAMLHDAGLTGRGTAAMGDPAPSNMAATAQNVAMGKSSNLLKILGGIIPGASLMQLIPGLIGSGDAEQESMGDAVRDNFGDEVGDAWEAGDVEGVYYALGDLSEDATTGDPERDDAISQQVLAALAAEKGEPLTPAEIGGLFTRWRTNAAIKRGTRRRIKDRKKSGLRRAKVFATRTPSIPSEEMFNEQGANQDEFVDEPQEDIYGLDGVN